MKITRLLLLSFLLIILTLSPVSAQPGTEEDPLVSKKYVDDQINALKDLIARGGANATVPITNPSIENQPYIPPVTPEITPEVRVEILAEAMAGFESAYGDLLRQAAAGLAGTDGNYPIQLPPADIPLFEVVFAPTGSVIYCDTSTELILRGGEAVVISGENGLCDVTSGVDLVNGQAVPYNHLLITPVGDGRGVYVSYDAYLMIRGGYYFG